jgi:hypothetical protein
MSDLDGRQDWCRKNTQRRKCAVAPGCRWWAREIAVRRQSRLCPRAIARRLGCCDCTRPLQEPKRPYEKLYCGGRVPGRTIVERGMRSRQPLVGQVRVPEPVQSGKPRALRARIQSFGHRVVATGCGSLRQIPRERSSHHSGRQRRQGDEIDVAHHAAAERQPSLVKVVAIERPRGCRKQCKGSRALRQSDRWRLKKAGPTDTGRRTRSSARCAGLSPMWRRHRAAAMTPRFRHTHRIVRPHDPSRQASFRKHRHGR